MINLLARQVLDGFGSLDGDRNSPVFASAANLADKQTRFKTFAYSRTHWVCFGRPNGFVVIARTVEDNRSGLGADCIYGHQKKGLGKFVQTG